ncbi:MAG: threonine synthase [Candidatus Lloydbacteria bacterium RIFCSPHIGHO2_01_FULL_54_11]|nr:MAG: threonine synthase [Candidatus Lloydbacteria bacterium RIFCSPHIGHO2_01_FULL_54_11]OGZ16391.1 MAG: threonine synthase [Candidatus Lloydbacteria bacterium RIFCSPLOWO2_02_FULL_54_12]
MRSQGILEKYASWIKLPDHAIPLSLNEGDTPLIPVPKLAKGLGGGFALYVKFEGANPTGSFKDRGMVAAVSEAVGSGATTLICASTGNTAASAAAYAARAGVKAVVLIPEGKVARGKLAAAAIYGAKIIQIDGSFDDALTLVREVATKLPVALVNSVNPYRLEGQKTAAFELCDELGRAPDLVCIPVGNAGNITAYHKGFVEYDAKKKTGVPTWIGVQAEGAAPLVLGKIVAKPETVATAIRIGNPARGKEALEVIAATKGKMLAASDAEILDAQKLLASEGIWVEPASAAPLAGLMKDIKAGCNLNGKTVVLVCTGNGLKDPDIVSLPDPVKVRPLFEEIRGLL